MADNYLQRICKALQQSKSGDSVDLVGPALSGSLGVGQFLQTATQSGQFLLVNVTGLECDPNARRSRCSSPPPPAPSESRTSKSRSPSRSNDTNSIIYSTIAPKVDGQPFTLAYVGGVDMTSYLPSPLAALANVGVDLVSFAFVYEEPSHLESVRVKLVAKTDWSIVTDIVTLAQASIDLTVPLQYPTYTSGTVGGVVTLFDGSARAQRLIPVVGGQRETRSSRSASTRSSTSCSASTCPAESPRERSRRSTSPPDPRRSPTPPTSHWRTTSGGCRSCRPAPGSP